MKPARGLRAVAERAGVSAMTVSLALRHDPRIPDATRARVERIAREVGYRPDPQLSTLMSYLRRRGPVVPQGTLAWINPYRDRQTLWDTPTYKLFFEGAASRAPVYGFRLEEFWLHSPGMTGARLSGILRSRGIKGVILAPRQPDEPPPDLEWQDFAAVVVGSTRYTPELHRVCNHQFQGMTLALQQLRLDGWPSVGVVLRRRPVELSDNMPFAAYCVFRDTHKYDMRLTAYYAEEVDEEEFVAWFRKERPAIIVTLHNKVRQWIRRLPADLRRGVGFVNLDLPRPSRGVAGIDQHSDLIGVAAVDLLVQQMQAGEFGVPHHPRLMMVEGSWVKGRSATPWRPT